MKIRIKGNSIRFRLTKSDVDRFSQNGAIDEITRFGNDLLIYSLKQYSNSNLSAIFRDNKITLFIPDILAREWISTDRVGLAYNEEGLELLVEKDFKCLDNVDEDQSDNYPNPQAGIKK
jgi:hypothetical protein